MIRTIKDFTVKLLEELKYHDTVAEHKNNLEATLWGLEEQVRFPENTSNADQKEIVEGINRCQMKIASCNKLLLAHEKKIVSYINSFSDRGECTSCTVVG